MPQLWLLSQNNISMMPLHAVYKTLSTQSRMAESGAKHKKASYERSPSGVVEMFVGAAVLYLSLFFFCLCFFARYVCVLSPSPALCAPA
jgi:hypothetical protein